MKSQPTNTGEIATGPTPPVVKEHTIPCGDGWCTICYRDDDHPPIAPNPPDSARIDIQQRVRL